MTVCRALPVALVLAVGAAACATTATIRLPEGPWTDDPLAAGAFQSASEACRGVRTLTAELAVRGRAGQARIRGRVLAGFERGGAIAPRGPGAVWRADLHSRRPVQPGDAAAAPRPPGSSRLRGRRCARGHHRPAAVERRPARARVGLPRGRRRAGWHGPAQPGRMVESGTRRRHHRVPGPRRRRLAHRRRAAGSRSRWQRLVGVVRRVRLGVSRRRDDEAGGSRRKRRGNGAVIRGVAAGNQRADRCAGVRGGGPRRRAAADARGVEAVGAARRQGSRP